MNVGYLKEYDRDTLQLNTWCCKKNSKLLRKKIGLSNHLVEVVFLEIISLEAIRWSQRLCHFSKYFWNFCFLTVSNDSSESTWMSSTLLKGRPFIVILIFGKRNESQGAKSWENGGWGTTTMLFSARKQWSFWSRVGKRGTVVTVTRLIIKFSDTVL